MKRSGSAPWASLPLCLEQGRQAGPLPQLVVEHYLQVMVHYDLCRATPTSTWSRKDHRLRSRGKLREERGPGPEYLIALGCDAANLQHPTALERRAPDHAFRGIAFDSARYSAADNPKPMNHAYT